MFLWRHWFSFLYLIKVYCELMLFHLWLNFLMQLGTHELVFCVTILVLLLNETWLVLLVELILRAAIRIVQLCSLILIDQRNNNSISFVRLNLTLLTHKFCNHASVSHVQVSLWSVMMNKGACRCWHENLFLWWLLLLVWPRELF